MEHSLEARLLLVDDDPEAIRMLSGMLPDYANQRFATSGKDALRLARAETPDLILLDIEMPDTDGFEVFRRLKSDRRLADVPVIFVTNNDGPAAEAAALDLGAVDLIGKPAAPPVLRARVAMHLKLRRLSETLDRLAPLDMLTGAASRTAFDQALQSERPRALRARQPVSLLIAEIDFFKEYNELYGRPRGDECLRRLARVLQTVTHRPGDVLARHGGGAFALLLPDTPGDGAVHVARRLIDAVDALGLPHPASPVAGHVTVSVGVSCAESPPAAAHTQAGGGVSLRPNPAAESEAGADDLLRAADRAMQAARDGGRAQAFFVALAGIGTPSAAHRVAVARRNMPRPADATAVGAGLPRPR